MELVIRTADLHAASVRLAACSARLADARTSFTQRAHIDAPELGVKIAESTSRGAITAEHGVDAITTDIEKLADALANLAHLYARVDSGAVGRQ
jgi:hypothetical protein